MSLTTDKHMWPLKAIVPQWWSVSVLCSPRGHPPSPANLYLAATEDTSVHTLWLHYVRFHTSTMCLVVTLTLRERVYCGLWHAELDSICDSAQYKMPYHTNTSVCHSAKHWQISVTATSLHNENDCCAYRDFLNLQCVAANRKRNMQNCCFILNTLIIYFQPTL
jgi:hypothetical protein